MQRAFLLSVSRAAATALLLSAAPAFAHVDLIEPEARAHGTGAGDTDVDTNSNQKSGPCGQVTNGRGSRVTTYAPGETITIRVREETPHDSYIRVSIDMDGDDSFEVRPQVSTPAETEAVALAAEEALPGADDTLLAVVRESNNTADFVHEIEVELPDETCTNCTLQVIQFMYGAPNPFYFQCADIVIGEGGADAGAGGSGGAAGTGAGGTGNGVGGAMMAVQSGGSSGIISAGGSSTATGGSTSANAGAASTASAGSSSVGEDEPADDEGGCAMPAKPGGAGATGLLSLLALALGLARRRR